MSTTLTFDGSEDSIAQAGLLVAALSEWLKEQPDSLAQPGGRAQFCYRPDGTLDSVLIVPVSEV